MEQHPVPRNVTGFQFRLVGDMTLKQFGYLAGGILLGFIFFRLPFVFLIRVPLAVLFALSGVALAFLPIQERPLDVWLMAFIKSLYSPIQYVYKKSPQVPEILLSLQNLPQTPSHLVPHFHESKRKLDDYLKKTTAKEEKEEKKEEVFRLLESQAKIGSPKSFVKTSLPQPVLVKLSPKPSGSAGKPKEGKKETPSMTKSTENEILDLKKKITDLLSEKEKLIEELRTIKKEMSEKRTQSVIAHTPIKEDQKPSVRFVSPQQATDIGMANIPSIPNIVCGVIKDTGGSFLPGILVIVKNQVGTPVRALKTNRLGQFSASTPLPDGVYTVEIDDPLRRYQFEKIRIELEGKIFMPIEVLAKGKREQLREQLYKEIFGSQKF